MKTKLCERDQRFVKSFIRDFDDPSQVGGAFYSYGTTWIKVFLDGDLPRLLEKYGWTSLRSEYDEAWHYAVTSQECGSDLPF